MLVKAVKNNFSSIFAPSTGNIKCIDGIRAISILMVMVEHLYFYTSISGNLPQDSIFTGLKLVKNYFSLDAFFTISGFLIGSIVFKSIKNHQFSYKSFLQRRFLRLAPAYYFTLLLLLFLSPLPLLSNERGNVILNFFYISNFAPLLEQFMVWSWSLCVEEQFYVIFPFFAIALYKFKSQLVLPSLLLSFPLILWAFFVYCSSHGIDPFDSSQQGYLSFVNHIYGKTIFRSPSIICGLFIAYVYINNNQLKHFAESSKKLLWIPVIGLSIIILPVTNSFYSPSVLVHFLSHFFVSFFLSIIIFYALFCDKIFISKFLESGYWLPTARLSYSLYLMHPIAFIMILNKYPSLNLNESDWNITLLFISMLVTTIMLATVLHITIEKPFMNVRKKSTIKIAK